MTVTSFYFLEKEGQAWMGNQPCWRKMNLPSVTSMTCGNSLDKLGDGVRIKFPVKIHITLSWSPKCSAVQGGILVNPPRMPLEKLTIDFVRQPFSILDA